MSVDQRLGSCERADRQFYDPLLAWHVEHARTFPWRSSSPFHILVAECLLHRTRASQVAPIYNAFVVRYPAPENLATADPAEVRKALAPLGLSWRIDLMIGMAQQIVTAHGGSVPDTRADLLALPGVGPYIADAVLCFGFQQPVALVDANTIRIAGRYLYAVEWKGDARRAQQVVRSVARLVDPARPVPTNYALLDFGALVCTARNPACGNCPVSQHCLYRLAPRQPKSDARRKGLPL